MAITGMDYVVLRSLRQQNALREGSHMLELGKSNWYGDVPLQQLTQDMQELVTDPTRRGELLAELQPITALSKENVYKVAKIFFRGIGGCASIESIDPGEPGSTYKLDLNQPVQLDKRYDLLINYGTGEHVFNVFQFYKTAHDLTEPGGIMIHSAPMTGWLDHGFYNFQPTFFIDLALANGYEVLLLVFADLNPFKITQVNSREQIVELAKSGQIPVNAMIEVALKKPAEAKEFAAPIQGYYAGTLSPQAREAWHNLR